MPPLRTARITPGVALALAVTLAMALRFNFLVDDAFISFRYARHLSEGHGLVWNLGEDPPVEGFSNFLWVVLCAAFERLELSPLWGSRVVSTVAALWLVRRVAQAIAARAGDGAGAAAAWGATFLASLPPIGVWATGGLETMAVTTSVFACFDALTRPDWSDGRRVRSAGAWAVLAVLLRADGFVWIGAALAAAGLERLRAAEPSPLTARLRPLLAVAAMAALTAAAYVLWRRAYFGEWAPNTARVKVHLDLQSLERGAKYVASLALAVLSVPLALAAALGTLKRDATRLAAPALGFAAAGASYVALVGGDWMMMHRMLTPSLPFVAVAFGAALANLRSPAARTVLGAGALVLGLLPGFDVHLAPRSWREATHFRWGQEHRTEYEVWRKGVADIEEWIAIGRALALHTAPGESMVLGNIGAFGYFPENLVVYDTHGLTNKAPLLPATPGERGMPGHDFKVDMASFEGLEPTYLNARIVPADDPLRGIPQSWRETGPNGEVRLNAATQARFEVLLFPLEVERGFTPGTALMLIKHRR